MFSPRGWNCISWGFSSQKCYFMATSMLDNDPIWHYYSNWTCRIICRVEINYLEYPRGQNGDPGSPQVEKSGIFVVFHTLPVRCITDSSPKSLSHVAQNVFAWSHIVWLRFRWVSTAYLKYCGTGKLRHLRIKYLGVKKQVKIAKNLIFNSNAYFTSQQVSETLP